MGQFTPSYQPGFNNYTHNTGNPYPGQAGPSGTGETDPNWAPSPDNPFNNATSAGLNTTGTAPGLNPTQTPGGYNGPLGNGNTSSSTNPGFASGPSSFVPSSVFSGAALNPNPTGAQNNQAGPNNIPPPQNQSSFGNPGWKPTYSAPGGYNPLQYADNNTANQLAQGLGGTVERTKTLGPFGDFGQNQISFGNGNQLNAGLLADRYSKYDAATANAMTEAEKNAGPAVTNPNAGAVYLTSNPMINPSQTPGYHPPTAPTAPTTNPLLGGPGSEPALTGPQPGAGNQQPGGGNQQNQLMQLLQLLGMGGQARPQNRQPYANSGYYPNLPRGQFPVSQVINSGNAPGRSNVGAAPTYNGNPGHGPNPAMSAPNGLTPAEYQNWLTTRNSQIQQNPSLAGNGTNPYAQNGLTQNNVQQQLLSLLLGF